jgi:hypothetical protein
LTPTNPGPNDPDEQKTGCDGKNNEQIKISFRHCPCVSLKGQSNARAAMKGREKLRGLSTGFPKSPDMAGVGMPQFYGREIATGELAPRDG